MDKNAKTILVVDDEPAIVRMVQAIIEDMGFGQTYTAPDAETALEVYAQRHPSMVLTDVRLPGMDGVELARRIKAKEHGAVPVLLMSAHGEPKSHQGDGFLPKPFDVEEFAVFVRRYANGSAMKRRGRDRKRRR